MIKLLLSFVLVFGTFQAATATPLCRSLFARPGVAVRENVLIVVEGAGDVVDRFYFGALDTIAKKTQGQSNIQVIFTTISNPNESPELSGKRRQIARKIVDASFVLLDKSVPADLARYHKLNPDFVITATPPNAASRIVRYWLQKPNPPKRVFVDKPLGGSLEDATRLVEEFGPQNQSIFAYSHYRAKPDLSMSGARKELQEIGGLRNVEFILTQDRSGSDATVKLENENDRDGAIEREVRSLDVMDEGIGADLLSHVFSILDYFAPLSSVTSRREKVAKYKGVDGDPEKPAQIRGETFLSTDLNFQDRLGNSVQGHVVVGKGVRTRRFGEDYEHRASIMTLTGRNGRKIIYDFTYSIAKYFDEAGVLLRTRPLIKSPYEVLFFNGAMNEEANPRDTFLNLEDGRQIRSLINSIVRQAQGDKPIPLIPGGMGGQHYRRAPYIEDIERD